jgi:cytochrome P450
MHRDPRNFSPKPEAFIPERWFGDPAIYETKRDAFIPFSTGPRNCVGRPLAMMELRYAIATIFRNFNFEIDDHKYDAKVWDAQILDRFTFSTGALDVKISFREKALRGGVASS